MAIMCGCGCAARGTSVSSRGVTSRKCWQRSDLSKNRITGPLPPLEHLLLIEELDLSNNLMSGPLDNLCGAPHILTVYLHQNDFTGGLPSCISTFSKLKVL